MGHEGAFRLDRVAGQSREFHEAIEATGIGRMLERDAFGCYDPPALSEAGHALPHSADVDRREQKGKYWQRRRCTMTELQCAPPRTAFRRRTLVDPLSR